MGFLEFEKAREVARSLNLSKVSQWLAFTKTEEFKHLNLPTAPNISYKDKGWVSYMDWLGSEDKRGGQKGSFLSHDEAVEVIAPLGIKSSAAYTRWCAEGHNKNLNLPSHPHKFYKDNGWQGWGYYLSTGRISDNAKHQSYLSYEEASQYAQRLGVKSSTEWLQLHKAKKLENVPYQPDISYKGKGWVNWPVFLGKKKD